jgi:3D (Asp-Asp-Asp) domain-containing protein
MPVDNSLISLNNNQTVQPRLNLGSVTLSGPSVKVGDNYTARVTTYYPSYSYERGSATEGGRKDNGGLPLTPETHGADAIIQRAVTSGQSLRENPPVLFVAADQSVFGYGSVLSFSGPQIKKLFLRSGASLDDAEYFASVGVKVVVRDVGPAIKTKGRFDLCTSRKLENVTYDAIKVQVLQLRSAGKPKHPDTPQTVLDRAIAFAGTKPQLSPPSTEPNARNPNVTPADTLTPSINLRLEISPSPSNVPADLDPIGLQVLNSYRSKLLGAGKVEPLKVWISGQERSNGTKLSVDISQLPSDMQKSILERLGREGIKVSLEQLQKVVPSIELLVVADKGAEVLEMRATKGANAINASVVQNASEQAIPIKSSAYEQWLSAQNSAPLKIPEGFKVDLQGKIIWPSLYGLDTSSNSPPVESYGEVNAKATEEEVKAIQRAREPIYAARAGYAERMYNAQRRIDEQITSRLKLPAPSNTLGADRLSSAESQLANEIGIPLIGLDPVTKPVKDPAVLYGPAPDLHSNPNSGNAISFGSSLGPIWSLKKKTGEDFNIHGRYSEQNRNQFESTIVTLEKEAADEELRQKTENGTKVARGEKLTPRDRALYQSKLSDASFMRALVNYYKEIQSSSLPAHIKQAYLKGLSNLVMAWVSGEKYEPVSLPNTKNDVAGVSTLTLPYMLFAVLKGNEPSSAALRRNPSDGGMTHIFMRLNGGVEQAIPVQTRKGFFVNAPYFRTQSQIDNGVGLPSDIAIAKPGKPLRKTPPTEVSLEDIRARSQETLRNNLRDYFNANPQAWANAQSNPNFMAYLDRLMFARNADGSPAQNQHRLVSVQFIERARESATEQNSSQRIPKDLSDDSNLSFYRRSDFENPYRARTE